MSGVHESQDGSKQSRELPGEDRGTTKLKLERVDVLCTPGRVGGVQVRPEEGRQVRPLTQGVPAVKGRGHSVGRNMDGRGNASFSGRCTSRVLRTSCVGIECVPRRCKEWSYQVRTRNCLPS